MNKMSYIIDLNSVILVPVAGSVTWSSPRADEISPCMYMPSKGMSCRPMVIQGFFNFVSSLSTIVVFFDFS